MVYRGISRLLIISLSTSSVVAPSISRSGVRCMRWRNTAGAAYNTSSGITKLRPRSTPMAFAVCIKAIDALGDAPMYNDLSLRVANTKRAINSMSLGSMCMARICLRACSSISAVITGFISSSRVVMACWFLPFKYGYLFLQRWISYNYFHQETV